MKSPYLMAPRSSANAKSRSTVALNLLSSPPAPSDIGPVPGCIRPRHRAPARPAVHRPRPAAAGDTRTPAACTRRHNAGPRALFAPAPHNPQPRVSPAGPGGPYIPPADVRDAGVPEPGRYRDLRIALCFRKTDTNPGKYLEAAMVRAGITVDLHTDEIDWNAVPTATDAVVFVEGPYPALTVMGTNPGIPVLFWVHHGEHHVATNLRLVDRYGAHAVLLAHSWHLAHRFPVPIHRFTFGLAPELVDASIPWAERKYAVSMVGGQLRRKGGT